MIVENIRDIIMAFAAMSIPLVALVGVLSVAIIKMLGRQRLEELASRERLAAIERGVSPSRLPAAGNL